MMKKFFILIALCCMSIAVAAKMYVYGTVVDEQGKPLIGASITVDGAVIGTVTNWDGWFELDMPDGKDMIEVNYVGMQTQHLKVQSEMRIVMREEAPASDAKVTNVVAEQVGKKIVISYQLDKQTDISIQYSTDGGRNYQTMSHISGDVGKQIAAGQRAITWDVLAEMEKLVCNNLVFKVTPSGGTKLIFNVKGVEFAMVEVEGGTFTMGTNGNLGYDGEFREKPAHKVTLSTYYMGETEVTQALWVTVMKKNPSTGNIGDNYPVNYVRWSQCQTFIRKLNKLLSSQLNGKHFTMPTEAQWEYAARGGRKSKAYMYSGSNTLTDVAWFKENSLGTKHHVKTKQANELGIYDMNGNVEEWCQDWYDRYSSTSQTNPVCKRKGSLAFRVVRGGDWNHEMNNCRVSYRDFHSPSYCSSMRGLRLVCIP